MGVVWAATHTVTGKTCALKFLKDSTSYAAAARERFLREARAACAIRHPNVAPVHDVLETPDGLPFMVMDLLDGEPLSRFLARASRLPLEETARLIVPVIDAVEAIHAEGIVHRDLKPDNIFVVRGPGGVDVKVLDFGIAKLAALGPDGVATPTLTATGAMMGTPYYMAPEQIFGDKDVDARADVWAIGVILYECLAGRRPTEADGVGQIVKLIATEGVRPLGELAPQTPGDLAAVVDRMLSRDRAWRPPLAEVRALLARHASPTTTARSAVPPSSAPQIVADTTANPLADTSLRDAPPASARPADLEADRWPARSPAASRSGALLWTAILVGCSGLGVLLFFVRGPVAEPTQQSSNAFADKKNADPSAQAVGAATARPPPGSAIVRSEAPDAGAATAAAATAAAPLATAKPTATGAQQQKNSVTLPTRNAQPVPLASPTGIAK